MLEPADTVPIDKNIYGVELKNYWITSDYVATRSGDGSYGALQALTYYAGADSKDADGAEYQEHLAVPQYIQAVDMPYYPYVSVGYLDLPDSVIFVDTDGVKDFTDDDLVYDRGLQVTKGYTVADGNPRYTAQDGLLYNKAMTEILGVPTGRTELTVEKNVTSVHLPYRSKLTSLTLAADSMDALPEVNYAQMARGGTIYVHANLLDDFLLSQRTLMNRLHLHVAAIEDPARKYTVRDDLAVTDDGKVHRALASAAQQLKLPEYVTELEAGSLQYLTKLSLLLLPENGDAVTFADGWADGAALTRIGCYTQEQYDAAKAAAPAGVEVVMMPHSINGYTYMETDDGVELISVPDDVTSFDGTVPTWDGGTLAVTTIGDGAFQNCESLAWVDLPQKTTTIGYQAFKGCISLQGVLIGTTDGVVVEDEAFDECPTLRFVASNSADGDIRDTDFSLVSANGNSMLYAPTVADGYNKNWTAFTEASGVTGYALVDCGGTRALYGLNANDDPWLMLRSGSTVNGEMTLPDTTVEIFVEAVQGAHAADGGVFDVNWDELWSLGYIDGSAFADSDLGAVITLGPDMVLGDYTFENCHKLTEITLPSEWGGVALDWGIFTNCENLTKVTFGTIRYGSALYAGMFNGCTGGADGHIDLYFEGYGAPSMMMYVENAPFYFNAYDWYDAALEAEHISVHVQESQQQEFLDTWRTP
ncbi:leucine-rich repeat protein [Gemmiger sp.]